MAYLKLKLTSIKRRRKLLMIMPRSHLRRPLFPSPPDPEKKKNKITVEIALPDWTALMAMVEKNDTALDAAQHKISVRKHQLDLEIMRLDREIAKAAKKPVEIWQKWQKLRGKAAEKIRMSIKVHLSVKQAVRGKLHVHYLVKGAGWTPLYDARLSTGSTDIAPALTIARNAMVKQNTGEDWNGIKLKLSTTRTDQRNAAPLLNQLNVSYGRPRDESDLSNQVRPTAKKYRAERKEVEQRRTKIIAHAPVKLERGNYHAEFTIPGKLDIASDGERKKVAIGTIEIKPKLADLVVPEKDITAYLYAKFNHNKGDAALLPGRVALYRDGMFVGNSTLPLISAGQEHLLGFGPDDAIKVRRETVVQKKQKTGFLIKANTEERRYRIFVHNLHQRPVK